MALIRHAGALPLPSEPWERAKERFLEDLPETDRSTFRAASLENLYYTTSLGHQRFESGFFRTAQRNLNPFLEAVSDFSAAMDVYANACPLILAPLWGSIRVVLNLAQRSEKHFEKLTDMLGRIGDILPRFRTYERLFPNDLRLMNLLVDNYLDVIIFCTDVKKLLMKSRLSLAGVAALGQSVWKPFKTDFETFLEAFRRRQKEIDQQANVAEMVEADKFRELQRAALKAENRAKVLAMLSDVDYIRKHKLLQADRYPGTGSWIRNNDSFQEWRNSTASACYSIYGIPGSGKTLLASIVADELSSEFQMAGSDYCIHYCDYADPRSLDLTKLFGSFLKQLFRKIDLTNELQNEICALYQDGTTLPAHSEIVSMFFRVLKPLHSLFIILDGIDELDRSSQIALLNFTNKLLKLNNINVKLLITCRREEPSIRTQLDRHPFLELSEVNLAGDIQKFIENSVESRVQSGDLCLVNTRLKFAVKQALLKGAKEMFLWVKLQLDELSGLQTETETQKALSELPPDVESTYRRIVARIQKSNGGSAKWATAVHVFKWILSAQRPLTIDELQEAASIRTDQKCLQRDMIPLDSGAKLLESCGNLIRFNRTDYSIELMHETVHHFLLGNQFRTINCSLAEAQYHIAELCITYLLYSDFETQITIVDHDRLAVSPGIFAQSAAVNRSYGGMFTRLIQRTAEISLGALNSTNGAERTGDDRLELSVPRHRRDPPSRALTKQYRLLQYVSSYWHRHTLALVQDLEDSPFLRKTPMEEPPSLQKLYDLIFKRQCSFEFKPWTLNPATASRRFENLDIFRWSIENGNIEILELLTKREAWAPVDVSVSQLEQLYLHDELGSSWAALAEESPWSIRREDSYIRKLKREIQSHSAIPTVHPYIRACQHDQVGVLRYLYMRRSSKKTRNGLEATKAQLEGICLHLLATSSLKSLQIHPLILTGSFVSAKEAVANALHESAKRNDGFAMGNLLAYLRQRDPQWLSNGYFQWEELLSALLNVNGANALLHAYDASGMPSGELKGWLKVSKIAASLLRPFTTKLIDQLVTSADGGQSPGFTMFVQVSSKAQELNDLGILQFLRLFADEEDAARQLDYVANIEQRSPQKYDPGKLLLFRDAVTLFDHGLAVGFDRVEAKLTQLSALLEEHRYSLGSKTFLLDSAEPREFLPSITAYQKRQTVAMLADALAIEWNPFFRSEVESYCVNVGYYGSFLTQTLDIPTQRRDSVRNPCKDLVATLNQYPQWLYYIDDNYIVDSPGLEPITLSP